jgi:uncharacterized membrane protein YdbT with pleckstrin-like domain
MKYQLQLQGFVIKFLKREWLSEGTRSDNNMGEWKMGKYIDENLGRDEQVVYRAKLHWAMFIPGAIWAFLAIVIFASADAVMAGLVLGILLLINPFIRFVTTELGFTNKRVIGKTGLINTKSLDSPLNKLNNSSVSSGLFGKIFGYGNVSISTSSGSYAYKGIAEPETLRAALMQQIERYDEDRIKRQAAEMASAIKNS